MQGEPDTLLLSSPPGKQPYHHGDLRAALLSAAEAELADRGIEGFSLRAVAKRAGVSHAAPAHHFGDVQGLLTALATEAHRTFLGFMAAHVDQAGAEPQARLAAAGVGYVAFAETRPTLFRLIFSSSRPKSDDPDLMAAGRASYQLLVDLVTALGGGPEDAAAAWAMTHGIADLLVAGRLSALGALDARARAATIGRLIARAMPQRG